MLFDPRLHLVQCGGFFPDLLLLILSLSKLQDLPDAPEALQKYIVETAEAVSSLHSIGPAHTAGQKRHRGAHDEIAGGSEQPQQRMEGSDQ